MNTAQLLPSVPVTQGGNARYALKTPYRDGTTHVIFEPEDFIARLAFVMLVTTRATARERAGVGLRRDALAFPGERGRFTCLNDAGSRRHCPIVSVIGQHRPSSVRFPLAAGRFCAMITL